MERHGRKRGGDAVVQVEGDPAPLRFLRRNRRLDEPVALGALPVDRAPQLLRVQPQPADRGVRFRRIEIGLPERTTRIAVSSKDTDDIALQPREGNAHPGHGLIFLERKQIAVQHIAG